MAEVLPEALSNLCLICNDRPMNVNLECGHEFCQACISKLEQRNDYKCPFCRKVFKDGVAQRFEEDDKIKKKADVEILCSKHQLELSVWCVDCETAVCWKCQVKDHKKHEADLIEEIEHLKNYSNDSLGSMKTVQMTEVKEANDVVDQLEEILGKINNFKKELAKLEATCEDNISKVKESMKTKNQNLDKITKLLDQVATSSNCVQILMELENLKTVISSQGPLKLKTGDNVLTNFIFKYQDEVETKGASSTACLKLVESEFKEYCITKLFVGYSFTEDVINSAAIKLENGKEWIINDTQKCLAAAHAIETKKPAVLRFDFKCNSITELPVNALTYLIGSLTRTTLIYIFQNDQFYNNEIRRQGGRDDLFKLVQESKYCDVKAFVGKKAEIFKGTIECLGCGLEDLCESNLNNFKQLKYLDLNYPADYSLSKIQPLPEVKFHRLHFTNLKPDNYKNVRPIIDKLEIKTTLSRITVYCNELNVDHLASLIGTLSGLKFNHFDIKKYSGLLYKKKEMIAQHLKKVNSVSSLHWFN